MSDGMMLTLDPRPSHERRVLVEDLIMQSSRVERDAIKKLTKKPKKEQANPSAPGPDERALARAFGNEIVYLVGRYRPRPLRALRRTRAVRALRRKLFWRKRRLRGS
jgi:hypothetical protein